jgi:exopolyphosphatase/guanosine-5'-triphosphate,3'-diphosphate pyrophosphatase
MTSRPVAVIDIGSNTIKLLVAARTAAGDVATVHSRALDARLGTGLSRAEPRLTEDGMGRAVDAIRELLADAERQGAGARVLVATSAVRDARNGAEFGARVRTATGADLRILTGEEEARLIGRGLCCDPALRGRRDFFLFDLGGGSLEGLEFRDRAVRQSQSFPLGCVRLTERFVADPAQPLPADVAARVAAHVRATLAGAGFGIAPTAPDRSAVGTGGTLATVRAILGARDGRAFEATDPAVTVAHLRTLLAELGALPLAARRAVPGLPPARADVFPVALATLLAVAEAGGFAAFLHSLYNLRYGLAAEVLGVE